MDDRTLTALKASIRHWEENVAATDSAQASVGSAGCALCQAFPDDDCDGCPVRLRTGSRECGHTPYYAAWDAYWEWEKGLGTRENWALAAQRELDFLKSLLPKEAV